MCNILSLPLEVSIYLFFFSFGFIRFWCFPVCSWVISVHLDTFCSLGVRSCVPLSISSFCGPSVCVVHFRKGSKYFTEETAQVFIPLGRFLQQILVLRSFLILLGYSIFYFFFHLCLSDGVYFWYSQIFLFFFFTCFDAFLLLLFSFFHFKHGTFF